MRWKSYGPHALLVEFAEGLGDIAFERSCAIAKHLEEEPPDGLREFVSGFTTVLLEFDPERVHDVRDVASGIAGKLERASKRRIAPGPIKEISVTYDGLDLQVVATANRISISDVCRLHSKPVYKVYMIGFAPGFPYLGDLDPKLHTPRLASPRPRVPAGSVAIGGEHTGIYTVESPGGWNIVGHTPLRIFDIERATDPSKEREAFRLKQGDRVKFVT